MTFTTSSYKHSRIAQDARENYPIQDKGNVLGRSTDDVDSVCCDGGWVLGAMATVKVLPSFLGSIPHLAKLSKNGL